MFKPGSKLVCKDLETAPEGAQARGADVQARPHPGHAYLVVPVFAELADHHRLPHAFVDFVSGIFAHPGIGSGFLKRAPVLGQLEEDAHQAKTDLVNPISQAGIGQRSWNGIEGVELALVIHDADRSGEQHLVGPTQFLDQAEQVGVGLKPMMIKTLHRPIPMGFFKARSQTAWFGGSLEDAHLVPGFSQVPGGAKASKTCPDDGDMALILSHVTSLIVSFSFLHQNGSLFAFAASWCPG